MDQNNKLISLEQFKKDCKQLSTANLKNTLAVAKALEFAEASAKKDGKGQPKRNDKTER